MPKRRLSLPLKWNSLFVRLLLSFLLLIALLLSFNWFAFAFFKTNVHREIVSYNMLGLAKSVDNYEKHFNLIEFNLMQLGMSRAVTALGNSPDEYDYALADQAIGQIRTMAGNPLLFLQNIAIFAQNRPFFLEKNGTGRTPELFVKQYASDRYDASFWATRPRDGDSVFQVYPAARFYSEVSVNGVSRKGTLFPIAVQAGAYTVLSFLDADQLFDRFHFAPNGPFQFVILDRAGAPLFRTGDAEAPDSIQQTFASGEGHLRFDDNYLFYRKGADTGFTYIHIVPVSNIASQVSQLNRVLAAVLGSALLIGFLLSVALSLKFNKPIRKMISVFQKPGLAQTPKSNIRELDWISDKISDIVRSEREIRTDLRHKNDLLKSYGYLSKVKKLRQQGLHELIDTNKPFRLLLFSLQFTEPFNALPAEEREKASCYIQELIALQLGESFPDSITLQVERDQVLVLLSGEASPGNILEALERLMAITDRDRAFFLMTIAVPPLPCRPEELAAVYEEACHMLLARRLTARTQIVTTRPAPAPDLLLAPADDQELSIRLQAGERDRSLELLGKCMRRLEEKDATADRFLLFAGEVAAKIEKSLLAYQLDAGPFLERHSPASRFRACTEIGQLERLLARMIEDSCMLIQEKKARRDPVKDFVLDYIVNHYREDLSLETVADQLQMSRSYLSTYFRDKTGMTFTDYLNALRMSKAKEMLGAGGDVLIGEVAAEIGYRNVNSFIRMFKKIYGMTPGEYRRMALQSMNGRE